MGAPVGTITAACSERANQGVNRAVGPRKKLIQVVLTRVCRQTQNCGLYARPRTVPAPERAVICTYLHSIVIES